MSLFQNELKAEHICFGLLFLASLSPRFPIGEMLLDVDSMFRLFCVALIGCVRFKGSTLKANIIYEQASGCLVSLLKFLSTDTKPSSVMKGIQ